MMRTGLLVSAALTFWPVQLAVAQSKHVSCDGILVEVDMVPKADFPMVVVYDNTDTRTFEAHTCVLDVGHAGHWPLRGVCWPGERCILSGSYYKKIGHTYYMRAWDKAEAPDHAKGQP
jgi:hypothetical protein